MAGGNHDQAGTRLLLASRPDHLPWRIRWGQYSAHASHGVRSRSTRRRQGGRPATASPILSTRHLLADSVGIALLVVLDTLDPAERLAFVLHDTFGMPFDEIASVLGRSPDAAQQLASRAHRRVRGARQFAPPTSLVNASWPTRF
jgi:hypothetical protein